MSVVMRSDLVPLEIAGRDLVERPPRGEIAVGLGKADVGAAGLVPRRVVQLALRYVQEVHAAHEEREVGVHTPCDRAPVLPESRSARAVERHDDELRWPLRRNGVPNVPGRRAGRRSRSPWRLQCASLYEGGEDTGGENETGDESDSPAPMCGGPSSHPPDRAPGRFRLGLTTP